MEKRDFKSGLIVKNVSTGQIGVTCNDLPGMLSCNGPEEVTVIYDGSSCGSGTDWKKLTIIGKEEAKADLKKCGAGRGAEACIFLTVRSGGVKCERFSSLRWDLIFRTMNAKRNPEKLFPACQFS